jgi:hypothetical protein
VQEIIFQKDEMNLMAQFVAQLVREGVTFRVFRGSDSRPFIVELTGGF